MSERVRIILELVMDDERWVQDALALKLGSTVLRHAEEYGVDLTEHSAVIITSPGDDASRRTDLKEISGG